MDYKPNSHRYKEEQKKASEERKVEKVIQGTAKTKKKGNINKFARLFISDDITDVKTYVIEDVLLPAIKRALMGVVDMSFKGGSANYGRRTDGPYVAYTDYARKGVSRRNDEPRSRSRFDYDDIVYENRGQAEVVLASMDDLIVRYSYVTVADMYDLADLTAPYTADKYGWTNLRNADVVRVLGGGYAIKLPRPMPLD